MFFVNCFCWRWWRCWRQLIPDGDIQYFTVNKRFPSAGNLVPQDYLDHVQQGKERLS
jgi:hypothetical protein